MIGIGEVAGGGSDMARCGVWCEGDMERRLCVTVNACVCVCVCVCASV